MKREWELQDTLEGWTKAAERAKMIEDEETDYEKIHGKWVAIPD